MAKDLRMVLLLDCYGAFLTQRQQEMMEYYYGEDLSLGEISTITGVTRQAVSDSVKRGRAVLLEMEEKLQFAHRLCQLKENYLRIQSEAEQLSKTSASAGVAAVCSRICAAAAEGLELL